MADSESYLRWKLQLLEEQIAQIDRQLQERQRFQEERLADLQARLERYLTAKTDRTLLTDLTGQVDYAPALSRLQELISQTQTQLSQERIGAWRDMQQLRRERRQLEKEWANINSALIHDTG